MLQAVVLAGGRGTRLRPYTVTLPKPLVPVGDRPILDIVFRQLKRAGVGEVVLSTGHMAELIRSYFGDGRKWGLRLRYVHEKKPLGTAGPLAFIPGLRKDFLVMNGDVLTLLDVRDVFRRHRSSGAAATVAVCERKVPVDFGVVRLREDGALSDYIEKPTLTYHVSMGVNVLSRACLRRIRKGEPLGMPDLILRLKNAGERVVCFPTRAEWLDIGRPEDYQAAQERFEKSKGAYLRHGR